MNLKETIVEYVGEVKNPEDGEVTAEMVVETLVEEFPDIILLVAQENFLRGYTQALDDVESVEKSRLESAANAVATEETGLDATSGEAQSEAS